MTYYGIKEENLKWLQSILRKLPHEIAVDIETAMGELRKLNVVPPKVEDGNPDQQ